MLNWLLTTSGFIPRSHCGASFTEALAYNSKFANLLIFFAYMTISIFLIFLWRKRKYYIPKSYIILPFSHFIFFCGLTHLNNFLAFTWPAYRYFIVIEDLTALTSLSTAIILPFVLKSLLSLPSFEQLRLLYIQINDHHQHAILELALRKKIEEDCENHNQNLKKKVEELESQLKTKDWLGERYTALEELKRMLQT